MNITTIVLPLVLFAVVVMVGMGVTTQFEESIAESNSTNEMFTALSAFQSAGGIMPFIVAATAMIVLGAFFASHLQRDEEYVEEEKPRRILQPINHKQTYEEFVRERIEVERLLK